MVKKDYFKKKSKSWDMNSKRVQNAKGIVELIVKNIELKKSMKLMDFGAGTGLLSYFIAPYVSKITAVDNSPSMLLEFKKKCETFECKTEIIHEDLSTSILDQKFDGIISSMTMHHLEDTRALFLKLYTMLNLDGFVAIADLDTEDGTFHSDNDGVFHYGFDRDNLEKIAKDVGFKNIHFELASTIKKPSRDFTVFLLTAVK